MKPLFFERAWIGFTSEPLNGKAVKNLEIHNHWISYQATIDTDGGVAEYQFVRPARQVDWIRREFTREELNKNKKLLVEKLEEAEKALKISQ